MLSVKVKKMVLVTPAHLDKAFDVALVRVRAHPLGQQLLLGSWWGGDAVVTWWWGGGVVRWCAGGLQKMIDTDTTNPPAAARSR